MFLECVRNARMKYSENNNKKRGLHAKVETGYRVTGITQGVFGIIQISE